MIYKQAKRIPEQLSAMGIGCWNFGGDWDTSDEQTAVRIVHTAIDHGINFFDVAPVYGWGKAETVLGKALKGGKREKVFIASKCGLLWDDQHRTRNDLTPNSILKEIDDSLTRLQTDYIDLYQLHWPDPATPLEETAQVMEQLRQSGKIRYVGLSNFSAKDILTFDQMTRVDSVQGLYNMLERNPVSYHNIPLAYRTEQELFPLVREHGMAFLPYSPLFQGLLMGRFQHGAAISSKDVRSANPKLTGADFEKYQCAAQKLSQLGAKIGHPINEITMNWLCRKPEITSVIGGVSSTDQLLQNLHALEWELTSEQLEEIDQIFATVAE
ncbi:MAG: aldo/keto reductase [Massiliimalia sp.]|jgi:aryl-alcohol dehydrogenase-like predicted oxidoreductase